jgi:hypothetical protein
VRVELYIFIIHIYTHALTHHTQIYICTIYTLRAVSCSFCREKQFPTAHQHSGLRRSSSTACFCGGFQMCLVGWLIDRFVWLFVVCCYWLVSWLGEGQQRDMPAWLSHMTTYIFHRYTHLLCQKAQGCLLLEVPQRRREELQPGRAVRGHLNMYV